MIDNDGSQSTTQFTFRQHDNTSDDTLLFLLVSILTLLIVGLSTKADDQTSIYQNGPQILVNTHTQVDAGSPRPMSDGPVFHYQNILGGSQPPIPIGYSQYLVDPDNDMKIRSNDVHFPFRASSDILYLTGWDEPKALFVGHHDGEEWKTTLFVRDNNELAERGRKESRGIRSSGEMASGQRSRLGKPP